jgi:hypothetical protein
LQAGEALFEEAVAPVTDGVTVAVEFGSDLQVGRLVGVGGAQDNAAAEGQGLRCGAGAHEGAEAIAQDVAEDDGTGKRHGKHPCAESEIIP